MINKKLNLFLTTCAAIVFIAFFGTSVSALSENNRDFFSFSFESCTVADALKEISEKSGINIISNSIFKKEILRKSYINRGLGSIIADLLRGENCAVVWSYNNGELQSIDLYSPDEGSVKRVGTRSTSINRGNNRNPVPGNRNINEIRNNYLKNNESNSRNRSNTIRSTSRTPIEKNTSNKNNMNRNTISGTSKRTNSTSGVSRVSTNIRRAAINREKIETGGEVEAIKPQPSPELPEPEKSSGLEPPPMPPGL